MNNSKLLKSAFDMFSTTALPVLAGALFIVWITKFLKDPADYFPLIAFLIFILYFVSGKISAALFTVFSITAGILSLIFFDALREKVFVAYFCAWLAFFYFALQLYSESYLSTKNAMDEEYETLDRETSVIQNEIANGRKRISNISQQIQNFQTVGRMLETFQISLDENEIMEKSAELALQFIGVGAWQLKKNAQRDVFAQYVKNTGLPLIITDLSSEDRFELTQDKYLSVIAIPVELNGNFWGVLRGVSPKVNAFCDSNLRLLSTLSGIISEFLNNYYLYNQLRLLSITDGLTGLYTHKFFKERLREEMRRAKATGVPLTLAIIDIDFFKTINDSYGHQSGDIVLSHLAFILRARFRKSDFIARYGGEEFAVILMHSDVYHAGKILEEIRKTIEKEKFYLPAPAQVNLTVSVGFVEFDPDGSLVEDELIKLADDALYEAKNTGRNKTVGYKCQTADLENDKKN
ncbi:MAG: sensor domain-containing diguanylate cyclase [Endomicrobium sp.]|jgi:diguanylate cyclase (GGDEF)-like protein|nr:sensor domain-containing diguanylate cyclase [Endomicrobium sp.]